MMRGVVLTACLLAGLATVAACTAPSATVGPDRPSRSNMSLVTWTDGKPAYSISCEDPQGCQQRSDAVCPSRNYTVLNSENMPTAGDARAVLGKPSVVVRCNS